MTEPVDRMSVIGRFQAGDLAGSRIIEHLERHRMGHDVTMLRQHLGTTERERDEARRQLRGAVSRNEILRGALLAISSGCPNPEAVARHTLEDEHAPATTNRGQ